MRTFAFAALALVCNLAFADGSPLFSKGPGLESDEAASIKLARPFATSIQSVTINREAINSTIITATVDGKEFRFIGGLTEGGSQDVQNWAGMDGQASMLVTIEGKNALGQLKFANRAFEFQSIKGKDYLIELVDNRDFSPAGVAAARAAAERKKAKP